MGRQKHLPDFGAFKPDRKSVICLGQSRKPKGGGALDVCKGIVGVLSLNFIISKVSHASFSFSGVIAFLFFVRHSSIQR
jgi:hypothetical protein